MTYYFGMDQTPEEAIKKNLFEKEEYQSFLGEQLASDYRSLYSELEKWAADRLRLLPVDAKDYYLAVSVGLPGGDAESADRLVRAVDLCLSLENIKRIDLM